MQTHANRTSFWPRRLHSLTGVIPIGAFLVEHLYSNSYSTHGPEAYNSMVEGLTSLPYVLWIEVFFIFLPILFHAVYGVYIATRARHNVRRYPMFRNWMFLLQRLTGFFLLAYIGMHVWETRVQAFFDESIKHRFFEHMQDLLSNGWVFSFYAAGVLSAAFHFANGLWTFGIVWGITTGPRSQRLSWMACAGIGLVVGAMGINSLFGFFRY